jgi:cytoskeletal protein RodZ
LPKSLDSYSIESDTTVLLTFVDGTESRIKLDRLRDVLCKEDQQKIYSGMRLRQQYVRRNLGSIVKYLVVAAVILLAGYDSVRAAQIIIHHQEYRTTMAPKTTAAPVASASQSSHVTTSTPSQAPATTADTTATAHSNLVPSQPTTTSPPTVLQPVTNAPVVQPLVRGVSETLLPVTKTVDHVLAPVQQVTPLSDLGKQLGL